MPNVMGTLLGPVIWGVRRSARNFNGNCTWEFSQIKNPVAALIKADPASADGICEMLSAKWIECHAKEDHLSKWLGSGGTHIDPSKVRNLMQLFIIGSEMNRSAIVGNAVPGGQVDQTAATKKWLEAKGILQRKSVAPLQFQNAAAQNIPNTDSGSRNGGSRRGMAQALASDLASSMKNGTGSYRTIGIWGPGGAHAMAAWVGQDVAFFDPNFGEFWFERSNDFINWFPTFWRRSMYELPKLGLSNRYEIMDYSLKAG